MKNPMEVWVDYLVVKMNSMNFSKDLLEYLLDVEIVADNQDKSANLLYKEISYSTNAFSAKFYLQYNARFDETGIINELENTLQHYNHLTGHETAYGIIVMYALSEKKIRNEENVLSFFKLIKLIKIKQYIFLRGMPDGKLQGLKFNDFEIGHIDYTKFSNFIKNHTGSNFASLYEKDHMDSIGIEMKNRPIYALQVYKWLDQIGVNPKNISPGIQEWINYYLQNVALSSFEKFQEEFQRQQQMVNSLFGVWFSLDVFKYLGFSFVNVFYNFSNNESIGWVLPIVQGINMVNFPDEKILKIANTFIVKEEKNIVLGDSIFKRQLEIALSYFSSAQQNIHERKYNNAYIDYFVGLDFLLAADTKQSKLLKQRISLLVHSTFEIDFAAYFERMSDLYNVRSNYVHNGISVDQQSLIEIRNISRIIVSILIRLHKKTKSVNYETYEKWIQQIDDCVKDLKNEVKLTKGTCSKIGIDKMDKTYLSYDLK